MIALWGAAIFAALFILVWMAWPSKRVSKSRLGIERQRRKPGARMDALLEQWGKRAGMQQALALADIDTDAGTFVLRVLVVALLLGIGGLLVHPLLGLALLVAPFYATKAWVGHKGRKRRDRFAEQLPDTIQMLVTSMRAGFGFTQALTTVSEEAEEPSRSEFAQVLAESRMGRDLPDALRSLADRMDNKDLEWVVSAIEINRATGGNLSEILGNVNGTIRERQRIGRKIRTYTAEGRMSAKVMVLLPCVFFLLEWRSNPTGFEHFFSGLGLVMLCVAIVLMILGTFWIRKIASIKF